ncbi:Asp23/Gls24 family envelope stress response protein [Weissella tructae]|jgi:uncharacterized alkaline shock family protein YloU|uniref:Alkaline shock protein n=2 Tax=Weissella TaxID=46255 RepID=A0A075TYW4_9LACO|nr:MULTISPECIES: Asp23/Gls24 family envelope stress response protein [Weissella]AIG65113.1 Alkaline shock protein [Weissella tructae]AIM62426.1 Alkaline shock protein [Weissella ceti]AIM63763.1 Alkaline shock protein [Weissella ceti]ELA07905.1 alkaline shock protein [Weissella ceti NC36]QVV91504.1 Asp23/Gls24 family envelope stress response protein [Weissella tructae]
MAEETIVLHQVDETNGSTQVNVRVIDIIASLAAQEVDGVASLRGSMSERAQEALGRRVQGKGVELTQTEDGLVIDVYVLLQYGVNVPKVGQAVQERVQTQISAMTEVEVATVNVYVEGMISPKTDSLIDPNNLFGEVVEEETKD